MTNKSAKDLAFDRERAKYGKRIKELETECKRKDDENRELRNQLVEAEEKCEQLKDWVERLLKYTELSEEDMKTITQKDKDSAEVMARMKGLLGITKLFGSYC